MLNLDRLRQLESLVADVAQQELIPRFRRVEATRKADGSLLTEADLQIQSRLLDALERAYPQYQCLGEEMTPAQQQELLGQQDTGLWILDPLDGTANFAAGIPYFGISLALVGDGRVQAGIVHDPVRQETFSALLGRGAWLNGEPLRLAADAPTLREAMALVDLKRLPAELIGQLAGAAPYRSQRSFGSVALDWCWLAADRVQIYLHGGQRLWDYAAGSLVLAEAGGSGGVFEDYAGTRVGRPVLEPRIGIAATSEALFAQWDGWLRAAMAQSVD
jgi:myo-inositol-1(or 4)-monophosphatase